jgi:hypothetical protein
MTARCAAAAGVPGVLDCGGAAGDKHPPHGPQTARSHARLWPRQTAHGGSLTHRSVHSAALCPCSVTSDQEQGQSTESTEPSFSKERKEHGGAGQPSLSRRRPVTPLTNVGDAHP